MKIIVLPFSLISLTARSLKKRSGAKIMAEVLSKPQFQILTHQYTGEKTGRIYFPALFLTEFHINVTQWLQQQEIIFGEADLKQYGDGSFRLYFRVVNALDGEYFQLVNTLMEKSIYKNEEKSRCS